MSLIRSASTIGFFTLISRVFGFVRDIFIARFLGASALTDAFFVAFKLPNFMRRLFAEGAFNAAFVPLYAATLTEEGKAPAQKMAGEAMSVLLLTLIAVTVLMEIFAPQLMVVLAPGFSGDPDKFALTVTLTRITLPYIIFISLVSLLGGILNSFEKFAAVAATPILMNLTLITAIVGFRDVFPTPAHALAWGVFAAGVVQFLWLVVVCVKLKLMPRLNWPVITPKVKRLLILIGPAALGAGVAQINLMIDMIIASSIPEGVSYLYYADRIVELPLAVIGIGIGTALLPMLSKQLRQEDKSIAQHTQNRAIELVLLLSLPAAAALMVIAQPIIATLFEYGAFGSVQTAKTYPALIAFSAGLPAFVLVKVLAPSFFAAHDTKTPFQIAAGCVLLNLILNLALIGPLEHVGMAVATSIASWANVACMVIILRKRGLLRFDAQLRHRTPRIFFASSMMACSLVMAYFFTHHLFGEAMHIKATALALLIGIGLAVYAFLVLTLKITQWDEITRFAGFTKR